MKNIIQVSRLAVAATLLATVPSFATDVPLKDDASVEARIVQGEDLSFKLMFSNPERQMLDVAIRDENGQLLFSTRTNQEKYNQKFDCSKLADGKYTFLVKGKNYTYTEGFNIQTKTTRVAVAE